MPRRLLAILLLAAFAPQIVLGGLRGGAALCLGGGHEHYEAADATHCELACGHKEAWVVGSPEEGHGADCSCVDVELSLSELTTATRSGVHSFAQVLAAPSPAWPAPSTVAPCSVRGPPVWRVDDPGGRMAALRSTRLLI